LEITSVFVGIDVSKAQLDVVMRPSGESDSVSNDEAGIKALVKRLGVIQPALIVLEATGGMERQLTCALASAELPVVVVNPRQVRDFAKATGQLAKTDVIDAGVLARFAEAVRPAVRPLPDEVSLELRALIGRRRQIIEMIVAERNRLSGASNASKNASTLTFAGWSRNWNESIKTSTKRSVKARSGKRKRTCLRALRVSAR
jgi:transposase